MTAMLAGLMALNAFAIDAMIPALPAIGDSLNVAQENHRQLVVIAYMIGFGSTQLIWGPLADRFGRKPVLASGIALYAVFSVLAAVAGTFTMDWLWFPTLLGWLIKAITIRYGGMKLYRAFIPFFIGLILGDYVIGGLWALIGLALDIRVYRCFPI